MPAILTLREVPPSIQSTDCCHNPRHLHTRKGSSVERNNGLQHHARGGIRTRDLRLRRPTLYPAELLALENAKGARRAPFAMVGASGFEPPTSWSRTRRANRAAPRPAGNTQSNSCYNTLPSSTVKEFPTDSNAPGETRTPNLLIRSQMLYPIELRALDQLVKATAADTPERVRRRRSKLAKPRKPVKTAQHSQLPLRKTM